MPQNGNRDTTNIFHRDAKAAVHGGHGFSAVDEKLTGPRTRAPVNQFFDKLRSPLIGGSRRAHEMRNILDHKRTDRDALDQLLNIYDGSSGKNLVHFWFLVAGGCEQDLLFFFRSGVTDNDVEHKTVQLSFR